jgi:hypothetical protein
LSSAGKVLGLASARPNLQDLLLQVKTGDYTSNG